MTTKTAQALAYERAQKREYQRVWYYRNHEHVLAYKAKWRDENREKTRKAKREFDQRYREKKRAQAQQEAK